MPGRQGHVARKRFGQNFLVDDGVIAAIVAAVAPRRSDTVIEIGPGLGALTAPLLDRLDHLHVAEIDRDLIARLRRQWPPDRLTVHEGDVLELDVSALGNGLRVVGNLPYNISSPLLFHLAGHAAHIRDIHVMLQKEVVERIVAAPGDSAFSRLSVMLQYRFAMELLFEVPPEAFDPAPQVDSAVVRLIPHAALPHPARDEAVFARVVSQAFSQRRKTLRNTLKGVADAALLERLGIDPGARAQELSVADFVRLADAVGAPG
ncbi:MAG: 16S rRNA (adenine(1518)-N(6)/adenine(1519)-N(6))-dimethyltransferase RsmA [Betaproteobacteria bacterium]|jgi:16S rRNA (adenine1518-N6/adenine1519-N6)-dimethyltransferase|nr:16S rRNA (adenine(1518)-N(6)/adenine(1519)-N(6))-dimethyltransferase RsmA [Betaproteobacteria bacterium]